MRRRKFLRQLAVGLFAASMVEDALLRGLTITPDPRTATYHLATYNMAFRVDKRLLEESAYQGIEEASYALLAEMKQKELEKFYDQTA